MTIIIRNLKTRPGGRESVRERVYEGATISIGRNTSNDVELPDLRIALEHAHINFDPTGKPSIILSAGNSAQIDGRLVTGQTRTLNPGAKVRIGIYEFKLDDTEEQNADALTITLQQMETVEAAITSDDEARIFGLGRSLPAKRIMAWVFAVFVLGFFLALPIWAYQKSQGNQSAHLPVQTDLSWNTGKISLMHANLKNDCKTCHAKPFQSVTDKACTECHSKVLDHAAPNVMKKTRPEPSGFDVQLENISTAFGRPVERCASCHVEHNGKAQIIRAKQNMCADCHKNLDQHLPTTTLKNVSDFGSNHPQFAPSVITTPSLTAPVFTVQSLDGTPKGFSGLKFPHDMHLSKTNAVAKMASKLGADFGFEDGVGCADCHRPEAGGALFEQVNMRQDCAMCHDIAFEDDGGYLRTLRHGEPQEVIASMRDFYLAKALANIRDAEMNSRTRRRPGKAASLRDLNRRELAFKQADLRTAAKVKSIFSKGGACYDCHVIDVPDKFSNDPDSLDYRVQPIALNDQFYPKSVFDHKSHDVGDLTCAFCHNAEKSKLSSDVLLPKIDVCRDCHVGEESYKKGGKFAAGTLPSTCLTCHTFHGGSHGEPQSHTDAK